MRLCDPYVLRNVEGYLTLTVINDTHKKWQIEIRGNDINDVDSILDPGDQITVTEMSMDEQYILTLSDPLIPDDEYIVDLPNIPLSPIKLSQFINILDSYINLPEEQLEQENFWSYYFWLVAAEMQLELRQRKFGF